MLFNSSEYFIFFVAVLIFSWILVGRGVIRFWVLLLASYYFYASNNHWYILLILFSTQIDYIAGLRIAALQDDRVRRLWLYVSIIMNLGVLGLFKYANFFAGSVAGFFGTFGYTLDWVDLNIFLPVGISFYTFQSMSYTIDVYRGRIPVERSWLRFALYISFFPQLVAGPIVRARDFLPQLKEKPRLDVPALEEALYRIMQGLFKKIVLADFLALYADAAYSAPTEASGIAAWIGLFAFSFQIYFDFSGYSDIAIGSARLLGYKLPENFKNPYISQSFSDFWRRWHISLSTWFRDYLYIPLGGSRMPTTAGILRNLFITMALCGLWHGAAWTFVFWGALHGLLLCGERLTGTNRSNTGEAARIRPLRALFYSLLFALSWIPFRVTNIPEMIDYLQALLRISAPETITLGMLAATLLMAGAWLAQLLGELHTPHKTFLALPIPIKSAFYACLWAAILVFNAAGEKPFIYFRF